MSTRLLKEVLIITCTEITTQVGFVHLQANTAYFSSVSYLVTGVLNK